MTTTRDAPHADLSTPTCPLGNGTRDGPSSHQRWGNTWKSDCGANSRCDPRPTAPTEHTYGAIWSPTWATSCCEGCGPSTASACTRTHSEGARPGNERLARGTWHVPRRVRSAL